MKIGLMTIRGDSVCVCVYIFSTHLAALPALSLPLPSREPRSLRSSHRCSSRRDTPAVATVSKLIRRRQVVVTEENASIRFDHRRREIHVNARWAGTARVDLIAPEDADVVRRDEKLDALLALQDVDAAPVSPDDAVRNATTVHMVLDLVVGVVLMVLSDSNSSI